MSTSPTTSKRKSWIPKRLLWGREQPRANRNGSETNLGQTTTTTENMATCDDNDDDGENNFTTMTWERQGDGVELVLGSGASDLLGWQDMVANGRQQANHQGEGTLLLSQEAGGEQSGGFKASSQDWSTGTESTVKSAHDGVYQSVLQGQTPLHSPTRASGLDSDDGNDNDAMAAVRALQEVRAALQGKKETRQQQESSSNTTTATAINHTSGGRVRPSVDLTFLDIPDLVAMEKTEKHTFYISESFHDTASQASF